MKAENHNKVYLGNQLVMVVEADSFPDGIKNAWKRLEEPLKDLSGRKYYGISKCTGNKIYYAASATMKEGDEKLGMKQLIIHGGKYISCKILNWQERISDIANSFAQMEKLAEVDADRYYVEWYKSENELVLYLPVT